MFFPLRSNLPTTPFTATHHASRLVLTLVASLLLAACGSSTPAPATPTPTPLLAPNLGTVSAQTYTQDTAITPLVFGNTGGDVTDDATGCTIDNPGLPTGLDVRVFPDNGKRTCRITGAPMEVVSPARMVTITATNTAGSDTATVSITVNPAATLIAPTNLAPLVSGSQSPGEGIVIDSNGVALMQNSCVFSSSGQTSQTLDGLKLITDASGCRITGTPTPTASATSRSYTILAVSVNGDDLEIMITLMVLPAPAAPDLPDGAVTALVVDGASVGTVTIANTGDNPNTCQFVDPAGDTDATLVSTLDGISVTVATNNTDCEITGALTGTGTKEFTVRATNATDSDNATVQFTVNPVAPNLQEPVSGTQTYPTGALVSLVLTNNGGGDLTECSVNNPLPNGLSVAINAGKDSCVITGIPDTVTPATDFEITATNDTGSSTVIVSITINPAAPNLSSVNAQVYTPNTDITPLVFANTGGGNLMRCSASSSLPSGSLPSGLMVTTNTGNDSCVITGIPDTVTPATDYKITATNVTGSDTVTVPITVSSGIVPDSLSGQNLFRYEAGQTVPVTRQITFTNFGGDLTSCTASDLPAGMRINSTSTPDCAISGAPSRIAAQTTTHTITAMHMDDTTSTATISIETYLSAPPSLSDYSGVTLVMGSTVGLPIVLENTGGLVGENGCQVTSDNAGGERPLSSLGLELAVTDGNSSCEIRAIDTDPAAPTPPTATVEGARYSISATNDLGISGAAVATFTIISTDAALPAPTLTAPTPSSFMFATNAAIDPINFDLDDGGAIGICTISEALPAGLRLNPSTCQISGTPRMASTITTYTVTATNNTPPAATADVSITVTNTAAPSLESMVALNLIMSSNAGLPFAIANTGGSPTDCAADPTTTGDDDLDSYNLTTFVASGTCVIDSLDGNGPSRTLDGGSFTITASGTSASAATLTLSLRTPITPHIATGLNKTYAINSAGQLFGWGSNEGNRLGLGDLDDFLPSVSTPTPLTGSNWVQISAGNNHTCAINTSGQLWCWGFGDSGQLGLGNNNDTNIPTQAGMASDWAQVSAGTFYTCAIKVSGQLWCWGAGSSGQLGLGNNNSTDTPTQVVKAQEGSNNSDWMQVNAGTAHTCAINTSGQLWCWGAGGSGRLGLGDDASENTPTQVGGANGASDWTQVSTGREHTCAIKVSGQLWCWGTSGSGQLGLGNNNSTNTPTQVVKAQEGSNNSDWMQVNAGTAHTCAINTSRQLWCWGSDGDGQLGLGGSTNENTPMRVGGASGASDWMQVSAGHDYTCAIKASEQLWCWGLGREGRLGLGSDTGTNTPAFVRGNPATTPVTAPNLSTVNPQPYTQHTAITNLVFTNTGGDVRASTGCAVDTSDNKPDLPAGLDVEVVTVDGKRTCRITGMPTEVVSPARMVTITATNITGSDSATFSITVNPAAPDLQTPDPQSYSTGALISVKLDNDGGGELTECGFDSNNPLPNGLGVERNATNDSCVITGTPDTATPATDYVITATNITGSDSATVSIAVISGIASFVPPGALVYVVGDTVNVNFPNTSTMGGRVSACVVSTDVTLPAGLSVVVIALPASDNGCTLTGTANAITAQANYTITARNDNGDTTLTLNITVNPVAPDLRAPDPVAQSYPTGAPVNVGLTNNGGGNLTECAVNNTLPSGLSVARNAANDSCEITGTPNTVTSATDYVITATNATDSSSATVNIAVPSGVASFNDPGVLVYAVNDSVNESFINTNAAGSRVTDCTFTDTPPAGLSINALAPSDNGCALTGTPTTITAQANYTITVTNDNGPASLTLNITVNPAAPILGIPGAVNPQPYTQHTTITNLVLTNTGGDVTAGTGCGVDTSDGNDLPDGLSVEVVSSGGKETCQITGTPTEVVSPARMVTITATNITNATDPSSVTVSITVNPPDAPNLSVVDAQVYAPSAIIIPLVFTNTGGDVTNDATGCTVGTSGGNRLPTGLSVGVVTVDGKRTCRITGMPTEAVNPARMVTITATNVTGSDTVTVSIIVHSGIVPGSSSPQALFRYEAGRATTRQITFTDTVGAITSCTVPKMIDGMPNGLPDGMMINSINTTDCTISGTPSRTTAETTTHTITAMHADTTTSTATISIETYLSAPPSLSNYSGVTLVVGSAVGLPIVLQNTGGLVGENGCQVTSDNELGKRPLSNFGLELAVTANNSSCEIKVTDVPPATPTAILEEATEYSISATNNLGVSGATATLTIIGASDALPAPTLTAPTPSSFTFTLHTAITAIDFTLIGKLGICTISPALPAGLRFDPSTCQISGTPRVALTETSYTITATNSTSPAATATVAITVTDAAPALESMVALKLTLNSNVGLPFAIANTGGSPTTCTATPTTASDDALDSYNLAVLVADGTCVIDSLDGNGPSRTLNGGSFTITPSSGASTTLTLNLRSPITPQIFAGDHRTYAINSAGQLFGWGSGGASQLGLGDLADFLDSIFTPALLTANDWEQVASGANHTCAINTSGQLFCWGLGGSFQLGFGSNTDTNTPTQVGMASDWIQVSAGNSHTCAIKAAGQLWCWGAGNSGQLGVGFIGSTNRPAQVVGGDSGWMQISANGDHTCAIKTSGQLWCWGVGAHGQLGLGNNNNTNAPMQVGGDSGDSDWMQVDSGTNHTCAIKTSGQLWCWGRGNNGRLGLGNETDTNAPMQVGGNSGDSDWMQVSADAFHTCAIKALGQLWCWGSGSDGRLGLGNDTDINTPGRVGGASGASDWMQVDAGTAHTCAIKTSGQLFCWGFGENGQLGLGSSTDTNTPTLVPDFLLQ